MDKHLFELTNFFVDGVPFSFELLHLISDCSKQARKLDAEQRSRQLKRKYSDTFPEILVEFYDLINNGRVGEAFLLRSPDDTRIASTICSQ